MELRKIISFALIILLSSTILSAKTEEKKEDVKIGIFEMLGKNVALDAVFTDENNNTKTLKEFMGNRPTIISMNYYKCPGICNTQIAAVASLIERLDVDPDEFQVLTISIEANDTPKDALDKKNIYFSSMKLKPNFPRNKWHFLVADQKNITAIAESIGFRYKKQVNKLGVIDYIHATALTVLAESGKIIRYVYGSSNYSNIDVKLALNEADEGRVSPSRVVALQLCFAYEPKSKKYVFQWEKIVGIFMTLSTLSFFLYLILTGKRNDKNNIIRKK